MSEPESLDCQAVQRDVSALLDGELAGLRSEELRTHFGACAACARFYTALREQLMAHEWAATSAFELEDAARCVPQDVPDYSALARQVRVADVGRVGRLLYEILKAEFLFDYGDGVEAAEEPIDDPRAERRRGSEMVAELRDWHDEDEVAGVDLAGVADQLLCPTVDTDRLQKLIEGMSVVVSAVPGLADAARYYQGLAHIKARREGEARAIFSALAGQEGGALARPARVTLATLPLLMGRADEAAIEGLRAGLAGDGLDAFVYFNLAKAIFQRDGALGAEGATALRRADGMDRSLVRAQLNRPGEGPLRRVAAALLDEGAG